MLWFILAPLYLGNDKDYSKSLEISRDLFSREFNKKKRMQIGLNNISFRAVFLFCKPQKFPEGIKRKKDISKSDL